jgi:hypothetical protein
VYPPGGPPALQAISLIVAHRSDDVSTLPPEADPAAAAFGLPAPAAAAGRSEVRPRIRLAGAPPRLPPTGR